MITYAGPRLLVYKDRDTLGLVFGLVLKRLRPSVFLPFEVDGQGARNMNGWHPLWLKDGHWVDQPFSSCAQSSLLLFPSVQTGANKTTNANV